MLCLINPEDRVPQDHPLREVKKMADAALAGLSSTFEEMYSGKGRPSIPPERLLKASVLMALYTLRSERLFCEQLRYNLLFQWFLDMDMTEEPFDHCAFSDNRERLIEHEVARKFFSLIVEQARSTGLLSREHFSVDGTLIEAWASMKSFRPKDEKDDGDNDGNGWSDFKGKKRSNETHESKTDPEAKLMRKGRGKEAKLCFAGHALMENRNGLLLDFRISEANGRCEREVALEMLSEQRSAGRGRSVGADAGYNTKDFVKETRDMGLTPHVAGKKHSAIDGRTTRHASYEASQKVRKRIEQIMGWFKTCGGMRKTRYRGKERNQLMAYMVGATYNLLRIAKLAAT